MNPTDHIFQARPFLWLWGWPASDLHFLEGTVSVLYHLWSDDDGQDIAEYAVMLAVILVIVVGTIRLIGGNANNVFSSVASSITQ